jgi:dsRNA-specific ribonuclease
LAKFPRQYISSILENDVVTLLQEYTQAYLGIVPRYTYSLVGGSDHEPQFAAEILNLRELNASAVAGSKAEARKLASAACVAKMEASTRHRSRLRSLLHEKIATQRVKLGGGGDLRVPYRARGLIEGLRARHFLTLRVEEVAMALTMPGDVARLPHLGYAQTNESAAFCGSGLLEYFCDRAGIRQIHQRHDNRIDRLAGELLEIRRVLWPRGDEVSREKKLDLLQSILYLQYKKEGLETTSAIFERCLGDISVNPSNLLQEYDDSVQYMSILQERTQGIDRCLPSYDFTLLTPKHLTHAPFFRCIARYQNMMGAGEGPSKRGARNRAAFELLRALGDDRNHEKSASGETSG